jgi:hypothetical protein
MLRNWALSVTLINYMQSVQYKSEPTHYTRQLFRVLNDSFSAAAAACCRGRFHVKWDTLFAIIEENEVLFLYAILLLY